MKNKNVRGLRTFAAGTGAALVACALVPGLIALPASAAVTGSGPAPDFATVTGATTTIPGTNLGGALVDQVLTGYYYVYANAGETVAFSGNRLVDTSKLSELQSMPGIRLLDPSGAVAYDEEIVVDGTEHTYGGSFVSDTTGVWILEVTDAASSIASGRMSAALTDWNIAAIEAGTTNAIPGRVWSSEWVLNQPGRGGSVAEPSFIAVSKDGAQYSVRMTGYNGIDSSFRADYSGIVKNDAPFYHSVPQDVSPENAALGSALDGVDVTFPDRGSNYDLFLDAPAADIPAEIPEWGDGRTSNTHGVVAYSDPDVSITGYERDNVSTNAGTLTGTGEVPGVVELSIDADGDGSYDGAADVHTKVKTSNTGSWSYAWDGKTADGVDTAITAEGITFKAELSASNPIHFVRADVETSIGGIEITQLLGADAGSSVIYWDDTLFADTNGERTSVTGILDGTAGVDSTGGVHGWTADDTNTGRNPNANDGVTGSYGDRRLIEDWAYTTAHAEDVEPLAPLVVETPDLRINKSIEGTPTISEDRKSARITWKIEVGNLAAGNYGANDVVVTDTYPEGIDLDTIEFVAEPSQGTFNAATGVWSVGYLASGATAEVTFSAEVAISEDRAPIVNGATVTSPEDPYVPGECQVNEDLATDTDQCDQVEYPPVDRDANLRINKVQQGEPLVQIHEDGTADATIAWTIEGDNVGPDTARDVQVTDTLPEGIDPASVKVVTEPTRGTFDTTTAVWTIGDLEPGKVVSITLIGTVKGIKAGEDTDIVNLATITSPDDPYVPGECQVNETLAEDTDQCDVVTTRVTVPPAPQPSPTPAVTVAKPKPALPVTGADAPVGLFTAGALVALAGAAVVASNAIRRRRVAAASVTRQDDAA